MNCVDLFAGCGGLSLGFERVGFDVVAAFENWDCAVSCYSNNFNHPVFKQDLSNVEESVSKIKEFSPDLIIGGPPCQDFSSAGKRIEVNRAELTADYAKIVNNIRPRYFIMENVGRAKSSNAYAAAREIFKSAGYGLTERVIDASLCGVPQKRKRFICAGALNESDSFLDKIIDFKLAKRPMTLRDYFGDSLGIEFYYRHPRSYVRRGIFSIDEPSPTIRGVNRPLPKGYPGHPKDAAKPDSSIRALTSSERAEIQTFPKTFKWEGCKTDIEQMIGNAVPVNLAKFVAECLLEYINQVEHK